VIGYDSIEYASLTDVGIRRSHNQDAHGTLLAGDAEQWRERGHIFLVADGMGAHAVGELAAELAVSIIPHTYHKHAPQTGVAALRKAFVEANVSIHTKGQQNPEFAGMGTTTTALLLRPEGAWVGHVGDSRAYRIRDGQIEQLSFDHSYVWEMARRRGVQPEALVGYPSNIIIRSLGPEPLVQVDLEGPHPTQPGDIYVLCSDGLSGQLADPEIGAIASELPPAEACRLLVDLANLRGGPDNITVLIVRIKDRPGPTEATPKTRKFGPWYKHWLALLGLGAFLVVGGMVLAYLVPDLREVWFFALFGTPAGIAFITGIIATVLHDREEARRRVTNPEFLPPKIYRAAPCNLDRPLVDKLANTLVALEGQIRSRQWEADWDWYQHVRVSAEKLLADGRLSDSLRDYCRGIRFLVETFQRMRPRGEVFQPVFGEIKEKGLAESGS
jgi:protein phosphatase